GPSGLKSLRRRSAAGRANCRRRCGQGVTTFGTFHVLDWCGCLALPPGFAVAAEQRHDLLPPELKATSAARNHPYKNSLFTRLTTTAADCNKFSRYSDFTAPG